MRSPGIENLDAVVEELNDIIRQCGGADFFLLQECAMATAPPGQSPPQLPGYKVYLNECREWDTAIIMRASYMDSILEAKSGEHWVAVTVKMEVTVISVH